MEDFEKLEYEQCLALLKYYDERQLSLSKFAAAISSGVPTVIFAFLNVPTKGTLTDNWLFIAFISGLTALSLSLIFVTLVQNRLYFVYPTRQVNAIRNAQLQKGLTFENQMYLDTEFNAFKLKSTHTLMNFFVSVQTGAFFGLFLYSVNKGNATWSLFLTPLCGGVIFSLILFIAASYYLWSQSQHHPDRSVHGKDRQERK